MNIEDLSKPLRSDQIDFRVQSITSWGKATILAYKDARADMDRLDEVVGALGWKREHSRDNHNCIVSIFDSESKQWVSKEDTGTESNTEAQKGLASDSFKRACCVVTYARVGIGTKRCIRDLFLYSSYVECAWWLEAMENIALSFVPCGHIQMHTGWGVTAAMQLPWEEVWAEPMP